MKAIVLFAFLLTGLVVEAQKKSDVPDSVLQAFVQKYPDVKKYKTTRAKGNVTFQFKADGKTSTALFNKNGVWMHTRTTITYEELPNKIFTDIRKKYPDGDLGEVQKIQSKKGLTYSVNVNFPEFFMDIEYGANGDVIKSERKIYGDPGKRRPSKSEESESIQMIED